MNQKQTEKLLELFKQRASLKTVIKAKQDGTYKIAVVQESGIVGNVSAKYTLTFTDKDVAKRLDDEMTALEAEIVKLGGSL